MAKQLVLGCWSKDTLQKLLVMAELDADKLFKVMEAEERANVDTTVLHRALPSKLALVSSSSNRSSVAQGPFRPAAFLRGSKLTGGRSESVVACGNCGRQNHATYDPTCPAQGKQCMNCNKVGHFTYCCRSKTVTQKYIVGPWFQKPSKTEQYQ